MIVQRILDARTAALQRGERIPNTLRLPPLEAAKLCDWLSTIENDPFLGYTPVGRILFGMLIFEDRWVSDIVARYEDQLSFFDFGF